jgi:hypothetical protein
VIPKPQPAPLNEYVISMPTGFETASSRGFRQSLQAVTSGWTENIVASLGDNDEKLVLLTETDVRRLRAAMPTMVIERNIQYALYRHPSLHGFEPLLMTMSSRPVVVRVFGLDGTPSIGATVYLIFEGMSGLRGISNVQGECHFDVPRNRNDFESVAVVPAKDYWSKRIRNVKIGDSYTVDLRPLPPFRPESYDWGHVFAEMKDGIANGGEAVKIGIVDTGIGKGHPDLDPAGGLNCVAGDDESRWDDDDDGHGTHCAGVISALLNDYGLKGYAPRAKIFVYRVFAGTRGGRTFDIVKAIKQAIRQGCHIISMSLGSEEPQIAIRTATETAYEEGILCVAAMGNAGRQCTTYPAGFRLVTGVGAFGKFGTYPVDSLHVDAESQIKADQDLFLANFSNFGDSVDFCAPGVAIRSTVPGGYCAMDGTSMACPQVSGMAALALASNPDILKTSGAERVERLLRLLRSCAQPIGFGPAYEGAGSLNVRKLASCVGSF